MKNKYLIIAIIFLFYLPCFLSAYKQEDIIKMKLKQVEIFESQGNLAQAETIYKNLMKDFSHNNEIIKKAVKFYLDNKKFHELNLLLQNEKHYLDEEFYFLSIFEMYIAQNQVEKAEKVATELLKKKNYHYSTYGKIADKFNSRQYYEKAVEYYIKAREISNRDDLYASRLAVVYQNQNKLLKSIEEYLNMLNEDNFKFVSYRLSKLNVENNMIISEIEKRIKSKDKNIYKKLLSSFYLKNKDYNQAYGLIQDLKDIKETLDFARSCEKQELYLLSIKAYKDVLNFPTENKSIIMEITNKLGDLYYKIGNYPEAETYYNKVIDLYEGIRGNTPRKMMLNSLIKLSKIAISCKNSTSDAQRYINEAKKITHDNEVKAELSILLADCYLVNDEYKKSINIYEDIIQNNKYNEQYQSLAEFKLFLAFIYSKKFTHSDSIFDNFITHKYNSEYINNITYIDDLVNNLKLKSISDSALISAELAYLKSLNYPNIKIAEKNYQYLKKTVKDTVSMNYLTKSMADYYFDHLKYTEALPLYIELSKKDIEEIDELVKKRSGDCYYNLEKYELARKKYEEYLLKYPTGAFAPEIRLYLD